MWHRFNMNVSAARELLFGEDRAKLGDALTSLARVNHCSPDSCGGEFQISRTLGNIARTGKTVYFAGNGQGLFQIIFQRRGITFDDTPYRAHPDVTDMLGRLGRRATNVGHWARFDIELGQKVCDNRVAMCDQVAMFEDERLLQYTSYEYSSGLVKVVGDRPDDFGLPPPDEIALAAFKQVVDQMPELSRRTTQPFVVSFAEAVNLLAPSFEP